MNEPTYGIVTKQGNRSEGKECSADCSVRSGVLMSEYSKICIRGEGIIGQLTNKKTGTILYTQSLHPMHFYLLHLVAPIL